MRYTGTTKCSKCNHQFDYFCLPYKKKYGINEDEGVIAMPDSSANSNMRQMFFEGIDTDDLPFYTARCPHCKKTHELPKSEASLIPRDYFE